MGLVRLENCANALNEGHEISATDCPTCSGDAVTSRVSLSLPANQDQTKFSDGCGVAARAFELQPPKERKTSHSSHNRTPVSWVVQARAPGLFRAVNEVSVFIQARRHPYLKRAIRAICASHIANDDQNRCRDHIPERSVLRQTGKAMDPSPSADFDASRGWYT